MKLVPVGHGLFAKVDDADFDLVSQFKWHLTKGHSNRTYYARATCPGSHATRRVYYMHRLIMGLTEAPRTTQVDHRNGDTLDNRRENLRVASPVENGRNRVGMKSASGFKGVYPCGIKWRARIGHGHGASKGRYDTPEEAAQAYDMAARELHGQFARVNFPRHGEIGCIVHSEPAPFDRDAHIEKYRKTARELGRRQRDAEGKKKRPGRRASTDAAVYSGAA